MLGNFEDIQKMSKNNIDMMTQSFGTLPKTAQAIATEMAFAFRFTAERLHELGFINRLVDSEQLESGEGMSPEFKKIAAVEIDEFKSDYQTRFPGRSAGDLSDEDLLREVMNTVGKQGQLGESIRCVVSVSMLTEGWDANTVTHTCAIG